MPLYEVETPSGQRIRVDADSPFAAAHAATGMRPEQAEESFANKLRYYAGPHLSQAAENIGNALVGALEYLSPAGDINGLVQASRDSGSAMMRGDVGNALLNLGLGGASLAALFVPGPNPKLAMDEASRLARAKDLGYSDEAFYRGQSAQPEKGAVQFYSRDPETAKGFGDMREYRLVTKRPLRLNGDVTLGDYANILRAMERQNPKAAQELAAGVPLEGEWTIESLTKAAKQHGDTPIMTGGMLYQALDATVGDAVAPLRAAGYDAIDTGRDVRMLTPRGQRLKEAVFDPKRSRSSNLLAGVGAGGLIGAGTLTADRDARRD